MNVRQEAYGHYRCRYLSVLIVLGDPLVEYIPPKKHTTNVNEEAYGHYRFQ